MPNDTKKFPVQSPESTRIFIKKNTRLPKAILEVPQESADRLYSVITKGDFEADIFNDPKCHLYLLNLIENEKISYSTGFNIYVYLMFLSQFTEKQAIPLPPELKSIRTISISAFGNNKELTHDGQIFLDRIVSNMGHMGYQINSNELKEFIIKLPLFEKFILKLPYYEADNSAEYSKDIDGAIHMLFNIPFLRVQDNWANQILWIPAPIIMNFLLQKMSDKPMDMYPVFGQLGIDTLREMHNESIHPNALYSPLVSSNYLEVHGYKCGPFLIWLHDLGHTTGASLLRWQERNFALNEFPSVIALLASEASPEDKDKINKCIETINEACADFDLNVDECVGNFRNPNTRLEQYLKKSILVGIRKSINEHITGLQARIGNVLSSPEQIEDQLRELQELQNNISGYNKFIKHRLPSYFLKISTLEKIKNNNYTCLALNSQWVVYAGAVVRQLLEEKSAEASIQCFGAYATLFCSRNDSVKNNTYDRGSLKMQEESEKVSNTMS